MKKSRTKNDKSIKVTFLKQGKQSNLSDISKQREEAHEWLLNEYAIK